MRIRTSIAMLVSCLAATAFAQAQQLEKLDPNTTMCELTAQTSHLACLMDAREEFWNASAACVNRETIRERRDCREENVAVRGEAYAECGEFRDARLELCDQIGGDRYVPDFAPENFEHPDAVGVPNPYFALAAGRTTIIRAEGGEELVILTVTDEVKVIDEVPCRVVVDVALEVGFDEEEGIVEYIPLEVTDDWYAHHVDGDVWYCGELSRNFEDGSLVDLDGSFQAGVDNALPGILIPAQPAVGDIYRQEFAVNEAEDVAEVLSVSATPDEEVAGFECAGGCLQTRDFTPLEPGVEEWKYYLPGTGFVLALKFEDGALQGDPEELICSGATLDILSDPVCGIENVAELLETLCELAPEAFCDDPDAR